MSTAMNFGSKAFKPRAPEKGSFPLDHLGECKDFKEKFMKCLRDSSFDNSQCRLQSKDYLECRMKKHELKKCLEIGAGPCDTEGFDFLDKQEKFQSNVTCVLRHRVFQCFFSIAAVRHALRLRTFCSQCSSRKSDGADVRTQQEILHRKHRDQLMAQEPLEKLGFKDLVDAPPNQADTDSEP